MYALGCNAEIPNTTSEDSPNIPRFFCWNMRIREFPDASA